MQLRPECHSCLQQLVDLTVNLATGDSRLQSQAREAAREIIAREFPSGAIPARIANHFHQVIWKITGNPDPFRSRKKAETAYLARRFQQIAPSYRRGLESWLKLAVLGNAVDFFRDKAEVTREMQAPVEFGVSDLELWQQELAQTPGLLLYLADNAGEQFFDQPLVAYLRRLGWRVLYVVKGGPIQNDLTRADLAASGMTQALEPVADTGARTVGLVLAEASSDFRRLYDTAQLILAKGMGHFETMSHSPDPRLFFLLQAKCSAVAQALEVHRRTFVFRRAAVSPDAAA
jgi:uncharacterized protein with ATP-grasp and redox domains